MNIALPSSVQSALSLLVQAGFEAYIVGGCVRDSLMGKVPADWDITTSALPADILTVFSAYRTIETGIQHGTITVILEDLPLEITTYRLDGPYTDGRHPSTVTFTSSLQADLKRRDFTINAMAYHPDKGLMDPFDGQADLLNRTIRCVGAPLERFNEDALRILRALRFSAVLGFEVEATTAEAIHQLADTLCRVSIERITNEFKRLICGENVDEIIHRYGDVLSVFLPEIPNDLDHVCLSRLPAIPRARLAGLFYDLGMDAETVQKILCRLRVDAKTIRDVACLLSFSVKGIYTEESYLLRLLNHMGPELIFDYLLTKEADDLTIGRVRQLLADDACYRVSMLAVNGNDLLSVGIPAGPAVGEMLQDLLFAVLDQNCVNEKAALLEYATKNKKPVQ